MIPRWPLSFVLPLLLLLVPSTKGEMSMCDYLHSIGQPWALPQCAGGRGMPALPHSPQLPQPFHRWTGNAAIAMPLPQPQRYLPPAAFTPAPPRLATHIRRPNWETVGGEIDEDYDEVTRPVRTTTSAPSSLGAMIRQLERLAGMSSKHLVVDAASKELVVSVKPVCARLKQTKCQADSGCPSGIGCIQSDTRRDCCFQLAGTKMNTLRLRKLPALPAPTSSPFLPEERKTTSGQFCPSPRELDIFCHKHNSVSWCTIDVQCQVPKLDGIERLCCPTGCNYNVCVSMRDGEILSTFG